MTEKHDLIMQPDLDSNESFKVWRDFCWFFRKHPKCKEYNSIPEREKNRCGLGNVGCHQ